MSRLGAWKESLGSTTGPAGRAVHRIARLAGAALCSLAVPGYAQDGPPQNEEEEGNYGQVIVVTSERRATNLQDTPLSVVAITDEMAASKGIEDLEDLSKFTPNLSITPTRGGGNNSAYFVIRGIGGGGATGERGVGLYIDGIYMPRTSGAVLRDRGGGLIEFQCSENDRNPVNADGETEFE